MKRIKTLWLSAILIFAGFVKPVYLNAADFSVRLMPAYEFAFESKFQNVLSGTVAFDLNAFTVRSRDDIYLSVQASPVILMAPNVDPVLIYNFNGALGYTFRFTDRFSISAEGLGGMWMLPENTEKKLKSASGPSFGGRLSVNYHISPALKAGIFGGYQNYYYSPKPFLQSVQAGIGISINLTKSLFKKDVVAMQDFETQPLFPIFYAHYDSSSFGTVSFTNLEKNDLTNVEVSVYIEQFMSVPKVVGNYDRVKPGEEFSVELTAFLNESIMNQMQKQLTDAVVTVTYKNLGQKGTYENRFFLQTLTRNSMSWEDDRRAAAFVSAKDGAVQRFS